MIAWLNPGAFAALALVGGPVLVHLLLRHRARRLAFPSLRFLRSERTAAARLRRPSDRWLLLLRAAIVAMAVLALAQPLVVTAGRRASWNSRLAKAIVVDVSASMTRFGDAAARAAGAEAQSAMFATRIDATDLTSGLEKALAALAHMPPARREIVVMSDFQLGALVRSDLDRIPAHIGRRFVRVGASQAERVVTGITLLTDLGSARQDYILSDDGTRVRRAVPLTASAGVELIARSSDEAALQRLRHTVVDAGTPAPADGHNLTIAFAGATVPPVRRVSAGWTLETVLRLTRDRELQQACTGIRSTDGSPSGDAWFSLCEDSEGRTLVEAAATARGLIVHVAADPSAFVAAAAVRGALVAQQGTTARPEEEVQRASTAELTLLARPPGPVAEYRDSVEPISDARWCWIIVLALLAVESVARRSRTSATNEAQPHAA